MAIMARERIYMDLDEVRKIDFTWEDSTDLAPGEVITSIEDSSVDPSGELEIASAVIGEPRIVQCVLQFVSSAVTGGEYKVRVLAKTSEQQELVGIVRVMGRTP